MLSIKYRLKKREDFAKVFSQGAYAGQDGLSIKYAENMLTESRLGFPVGKNYSKSAAARNRARRILREAAGEHLPVIKPGFDIIVMIKSDSKDLELKKVSSQLKKVLLKAKLLI